MISMTGFGRVKSHVTKVSKEIVLLFHLMNFPVSST